MNFKDATQIDITLQRFIIYTLASLSSDNNPTNFIFSMRVSLKPNLLSTHVGGVITTKSDFYGAYPIFHK